MFRGFEVWRVLIECSRIWEDILVPTAAGRGIAAPRGIGDSPESEESKNFLKESRGFGKTRASRGPGDFKRIWKTRNQRGCG